MVVKKLVNTNLDPEDLDRVDELAKANTGGNRSLLIRILINVAWENPELFGLHPPKGRQTPSKGN